jgi:hypothetical protein
VGSGGLWTGVRRRMTRGWRQRSAGWSWRATALKKQSSRQVSRQRDLARKKDARLQEQIDERGWNWCESETCGRTFPAGKAREYLEWAHLEGRAQDFNDTPENLFLMCSDFAGGCHSLYDSRNKKADQPLPVLLPRRGL